MANKLLKARGEGPVGINWLSRFADRSEELKMAFNRAREDNLIKGLLESIYVGVEVYALS
ncbi:hypothetical protein BKA66DRAFT_430204 [Pyrenochaeta sp. MPI-SDFR-AT-0127]|nr:hypothetical protein BKA66DRAFT_430204 [Pyrenochaeta sp. MPI-SDFR-AT-0127]